MLTIRQVAEMMNVSRQTIYAWMKSGKLEAVRTPGGRQRIPEDQLLMGDLVRSEGRQRRGSYEVADLSELEPMSSEEAGSKEKYWFAREDKHWYWEADGQEFLFKAGREGTGENWAEKVVCELCRLLGLPHAEYDLAVYRGKKGVISPNFVSRGQSLILGNEILVRTVQGYVGVKRYHQRTHTLKAVRAVVSSRIVNAPIGWTASDNIDTAEDLFTGYLMLDTWIGNTDRHHENWGLILELESESFHLAPTFDHASSLGRELSDAVREERLATKDKGRRIEKYIERARSAFYSGEQVGKPLYTIDAFKEAAGHRRSAAKSWMDRLGGIPQTETKRIIDMVPQDEMSEIAKEFAQRILDINRERLLSLVI